MLVGELEPFFNWQSSLSGPISFPEIRSPWQAVGKRDVLGATISGMRHSME